MGNPDQAIRVIDDRERMAEARFISKARVYSGEFGRLESRRVSGSNMTFGQSYVDEMKIFLRLDRRIIVKTSHLGNGFYNREPFPDIETAEAEYEKVLAAVSRGEYVLEVQSGARVTLRLTEEGGK